MKRLRELNEYSSEAERDLARLFLAAERYRPSAWRKRRVNVQLTTGGPRHRSRVWHPPALAVLFIAGTSAAAAVGHSWLTTADSAEQPPLIPLQSVRAPHEPTRQPSPAREPNLGQGAAKQSAAEQSAAEQSAAEQSAAEHEQAATLREPGKATAITRAPRASKTTASKPTKSIKSAKSPAAMAGEDPMRVAEALRALRKEGDPERAQGLLADYLKTNPRGALSEEALALTIEAAHTRADPRAKAYARRYMARYPQGRHQALAQRVLKQ